MRRVINKQSFPASSYDFVNYAWTGGDDVHVVLAPQPLLDDLHVEQTKKAAAKPEAERD